LPPQQGLQPLYRALRTSGFGFEQVWCWPTR
jgi:hypothetical protein